MIPEYLYPTWKAIGATLGNHFWQSTLFAIVAGLMTLALRNNPARVRYWLWLAASVKFLIPFSLLIGVGSHLAWLDSSASTNAGVYFAMEEVGEPFTLPSMISQATYPPAFPRLMRLVPPILASVWLCGFALVLWIWYTRWRRISSAIREGAPLREGREVRTLRRLEPVGVTRRIEIILSRASLEPGIFGVVRPVLVWPEGISERLDDGQLEGILAHELWHVRRRDNLAAAIHLVVEAIFWFHPLVWWLGARLVEERERACDEEVVESGSSRQIYAEGILKVCEFCVESPLACMSGVTGSDLKKRMVRIMSKTIARRLDFSRKLLLSTIGLLALAGPIIFGLVQAPKSHAQSQAENTAATPAFKSVSIKRNESSTPTNDSGLPHIRMMFTPDGFTAAGVSLQTVIQEAYGVQANQIEGAPDWLKSDGYDIEAKVDKSEANQLSLDQRRTESQRMLQTLLADRVKLTLHRETKDLPTYALVVAESGSKLQLAKSGDAIKGPDGRPMGTHRMFMRAGGGGPNLSLAAQGIFLVDLAQLLSRQLGTPVVDKTGMTGSYDFGLHWTPDKSRPSQQADGDSTPEGPPGPGAAGPSFFSAIQEQLGLKLEPQTGPTEILVIDHVEMPSEN
jgi:bla regulator protein BlaR1